METPNFLILLIDTLRADHLGVYGYPLPTSANLDAFARQSVTFETCLAQAPNTAPSHASLFTSTYPATHLVWNSVETEAGPPVFPRLPHRAVTLAEVLSASGYQTTAIADGGYVSRLRGFDPGFDYFESKYQGVSSKVDRALNWLRVERKDSPFFMFLHTYETHTPYLPEPINVGRFARKEYRGPLYHAWKDARQFMAENTVHNPIRFLHQKFFQPTFPAGKRRGRAAYQDKLFLHALYDAEISQVDHEIGRLMEYLHSSGLSENTIVIVTSDHGEDLFNQGRYGHEYVYESNLRVPLMIRLPGRTGGVIRHDSVEIIDLMPTLLARIGAEIPEAVSGQAIDLNAEKPPVSPLRPFFAESNIPEAQTAVRFDDKKIILFPDSDRPSEFYRLRRTPDESHSLNGGPR